MLFFYERSSIDKGGDYNKTDYNKTEQVLRFKHTVKFPEFFLLEWVYYEIYIHCECLFLLITESCIIHWLSIKVH